MTSFDQFLESKIKLGSYQLRIFGSVAFLDFIDAIEMSFLGIFLSILATEWNLSRGQLTFLGVSFYLGSLIGHLCCAFFADLIGRKNLLIIGSCCTFLTMLINSQVQVFWQATFVRFWFGIVFGIIIPLSSILMSEMMPKALRGRTQSSLQFIYIMGKIYMVLTCFIFLEDYTKGNWRGLLLFNSIPAFVCFILSIFTLNESARYLITTGNFTLGFRELIKMGRTNNDNSFSLSVEEKDSLIVSWVEQSKDSLDKKSFSDLFNQENRYITIKLWLIVFLINLSVGMLFILIPFLFQNQSKGFGALLYSYLFELIAILFVFNLVDNQNIGRLKIILFCLWALCIISFLIYMYPEDFLVLGIGLIKFFGSIAYPSFVIFINESYKTTHRTLGVGSALACGKLASTISPLIGFSLYFYDPYSPFMFICATYFIIALIVMTFEFDKTQQYLDEQVQKD